MSNHDPTVDAYIAAAPRDVQEKLVQLRQIITTVAPEAKEKISYGMPYYAYHGRLVYFAYFKNHIGFYIVPPIVEEFKKALEGYQTSVATVRFPLAEKLPLELIKKMVLARVRYNTSRSAVSA